MTKIKFTKPTGTEKTKFNPKVGDVIYNTNIFEGERWYAVVLKVSGNSFYDLFFLGGEYSDKVRYNFEIRYEEGWAVAKEMEIKLTL